MIALVLEYIQQISLRSIFFFFNDTATTEIYTLSLHDALPIYTSVQTKCGERRPTRLRTIETLSSMLRNCPTLTAQDRKSTRLNSSHLVISYAVFCLKKKNNKVYVGMRPNLPTYALVRHLSPCW